MKIAFIILVLILLASFIVLIAQETALLTTESHISDPKNDVLDYNVRNGPIVSPGAPSYLDIIGVNVTELEGERLQFEIQLNEKVPTPTNPDSWLGYGPTLDIDKNPNTGQKRHATFGGDYNLGVRFFDGSWNTEVLEISTGKASPISDWHVRDDKITMVIPLSQIGNPSSFNWFAESIGYSLSTNFHDFASDGGFSTFTIKKPKPDDAVKENPIIMIFINLIALIALLRVLGAYILFYKNRRRHSIRFLLDILIILLIANYLGLIDISAGLTILMLSIIILSIKYNDIYYSGLGYLRDVFIFYVMLEWFNKSGIDLKNPVTIFIFGFPAIVLIILLHIYVTDYLDKLYNFLRWILIGTFIEYARAKISPLLLRALDSLLLNIKYFLTSPFGFTFTITLPITIAAIEYDPRLREMLANNYPDWLIIALSIIFSAIIAKLFAGAYLFIKPFLALLLARYNEWSLRYNIICLIIFLLSTAYITYLLVLTGNNIYILQ